MQHLLKAYSSLYIEILFLLFKKLACTTSSNKVRKKQTMFQELSIPLRFDLGMSQSICYWTSFTHEHFLACHFNFCRASQKEKGDPLWPSIGRIFLKNELAFSGISGIASREKWYKVIQSFSESLLPFVLFRGETQAKVLEVDVSAIMF